MKELNTIGWVPGANEASFTRQRSNVVPVTPELAQTFHDMPASPTERELDPRRVRHLREKIKAGLAVTFHWASAEINSLKAEAKKNGKEKLPVLRMNGNHSSTALLEMNGDFPSGLVAHIDEYEVANTWGLALLFRQFDDKKSSRTSKDICGAYHGLFPSLAGVPRDTAKLAVEGICWHRTFIENPQGLPTLRGDDVGILFGETPLHPFILFAGELFTIKTPELRKASIMSAIYETFVMDEADAREFWAETGRGGKEFEDKAPSSVLDRELKYFAETKIPTQEKMKPTNFFAGCIYAWNAHRKNKQIDKIVWDIKKGTPRAI